MLETCQAVGGIRLDLRSPRAYVFDAVADHLVLAGDIGDPACPSYAAFLGFQATRFRTVIVVAGDAEYRGAGGDRWERTGAIRDTCLAVATGNVIFLDRGVHHLSDEVTVIGCTLRDEASDPFMHRFERKYVEKCLRAASGSRVLLVTNQPPGDLLRDPVVLSVSACLRGCRVRSPGPSLGAACSPETVLSV
jgi:hypothetical protein